MKSSEPQQFFKEKRSASDIKGEFLPKFIPIWGELVLSDQETNSEPQCHFIDLNAGAVPLADEEIIVSAKVLKSIFVSTYSKANLSAACQCFFGGANKASLQSLEQQLTALAFYEELHHRPCYLQQQAYLEQFQVMMQSSSPAFFYLDPFGHKFSQDVWYKALERENSDFLFLLNPSRLKLALKNSKDGNFSALLGDKLPKLKALYHQPGGTAKKEEGLLDGFVEALNQKGYATTKFRVNAPGRETADYYLMLVSKSGIMHTRLKQLLIEYSDFQEDGVPLMAVNQKPLRLLVPEYHQYLKYSLVNLVKDLESKASQYNGMVLDKIYEKHNVGTHYSRANYFEAIERLKEQGKVSYRNPKTGQMVSKQIYGCRVKFLI